MAANGIDVPTQIALSGTGVTQVKGNVYTVQLSLSGTSTVDLTAAFKDSAGTTVTPSGTETYVSYNAGTGAGDVARVATVDSSGVITAVHKGQAIIECQYPAFDLDGVNPLAEGMIYAQVIVNVVA